MTNPSVNWETAADEFQQTWQRLRAEIGKVIVGNHEVVESILSCVLAGGHALLEGVPGLGKTLLVRTLATVLDLPFKRIQFTPDLMPADILGTNVISSGMDGQRHFVFQPGPVFASIVLADEINRATPKTQSALLEAMQERSVTVGGVVHDLGTPFFVMATQNPIEQEGTYPLPEAQLDRFSQKLIVGYSSRDDIASILDRTTTQFQPVAERVIDRENLLRLQHLARAVLVAPHVRDYAVRLVLATHPGGEFAPKITNDFVKMGSSPRGAQAMILTSKVRALVAGRCNVSFADVRQAALPALRHRVLPNFEATAEGIQADAIVRALIDQTPELASV